ncbi:MAG: GAF domain-containing protein [Ardenticatenaceae bacterium]|nr:GAF domain-containing protein [Ardenticatenaceae bacterium]
MGQLLQNDLIQKQFDLYYVQVYLADKGQTRLSLKAGTGLMGKQLVQRDHGLPFGVGSINGLAAAEKRAVVVTDTAVSPLFKANPLLPKTRSEMAIPMLVGEKVVGVLNLQSSVAHELSVENLTAFETLAGQIAIAVENANLFAETAQARADVERTLRFITRQGWDNFQDGLRRPETIGFTYEEDTVHPIDDAAPPASANGTYLQVPIVVADELVGHIMLEGDDTRSWSTEEKEMVATIAQQVGQQAENLRLLAETDRYRQEAEQVVRRMRREAWQAYLTDQLKTGGFVYDQRQVTPIDEAEYVQPDPVNSDLLRQPLTVQGEPFGEILLDGSADPETKTLVAAVAEQLSDHLENLRLSNQTEKALAETAVQARRLAALNELSRDLSAAADVTETFAVLSRHMASVIPHDFLSFAMAKPNGTSAKIVAVVNGQPVTIFEDQPIAGTVVEVATKQRQLMYLADVSQHNYADTNTMAERAGIRSVMIAPLITARGVLGGIDLMSNQVDGFDDQDQNLLQQIASLAASTLESQQLFAEAQKQAQKERLVNIVSQKIQSTVTIEGALETAITELGKALQARYTKADLSFVKESMQEN